MSKKIKYYHHPHDHVDSDPIILPCFQISSDVQYKEVPTTGEEYLLSVMKEREKCEVVTKCKQDYSKFAKNQDCFVEVTPRARVHEKLRPTIEWQNCQVADFSEARMYVTRLLAKKSVWPQSMKKIDMKQASAVEWKRFFIKHNPTLTSVLSLSHTVLDSGLEILTDMLNKVKPGDTIDHKIGQWIYSFLACTRQPLISETICILRELARKCAEIRSHINPEAENAIVLAAPMNLFICLVGRYFRQHDLAD